MFFKQFILICRVVLFNVLDVRLADLFRISEILRATFGVDIRRGFGCFCAPLPGRQLLFLLKQRHAAHAARERFRGENTRVFCPSRARPRSYCRAHRSLSGLEPTRLLSANIGIYFVKNARNICILLRVFSLSIRNICSVEAARTSRRIHF